MGKNSKNINGIVLIDKPKQISSHGIVKKVRKILFNTKVGHFGTLDPLATGLLVLGIGEGTKLSPYLMSEHKEYFATVKFGEVRDTYDAEGRCIEKTSTEKLLEEDIRKACQRYIGSYEQIPPIYSALKYKGRPLYKYARGGQECPIKARKVDIQDIDLVKVVSQDEVIINVKCSKGTYIRSLAHDIGKDLQVGAYLKDLRRTVSGYFNVEQAIKIEEIQDHDTLISKIIPLHMALNECDTFQVKDDNKRDVLNGKTLELSKFVLIKNYNSKITQIIDEHGLIAIGKRFSVDSENTTTEFIKPERVFNQLAP